MLKCGASEVVGSFSMRSTAPARIVTVAPLLDRTCTVSLAAARDVARLEYELAHSDVEAVGARIQAGTATLKDQENARLAENQRYMALLDAGFQLDKTQMQLLKATGELQQWAMSGSQP